MKIQYIFQWKPLPIPSALNVIWIIVRQYMFCTILAFVIALVFGISITLLFGLPAGKQVIAIFFPTGYAILAEESARWMYALQPAPSYKNAIVFLVTIVLIEGTFRLILNTDYISGQLNFAQISIFVAAQYTALESVQIFNSILILVWMRILGTSRAWIGFFVSCLIHYAWNNSRTVGELYLEHINSLMQAAK